jgi:hypothetical protein
VKSYKIVVGNPGWKRQLGEGGWTILFYVSKKYKITDLSDIG